MGGKDEKKKATPNVLFGLATMPVTDTELKRVDPAQGMMLRTVVGSARIVSELWDGTMHHMREEVGCALHACPAQDWTKPLARKQRRSAATSVIQRVLAWRPWSNWQQNFAQRPRCRGGRPSQRWEAELRQFGKL